jgi:acetoacetate decarboxylase
MGFVKTPDELAVVMQRLPRPEFHRAQMLFVFWETKPEIVARLLPPPLEPIPYPVAGALVAYYPETNFGPAYHEGALFIGAHFQGVPGNYCLAMPVSDDLAMAGGRERYGYPKKLAQFEFARRGAEITGRISRHGAQFLEITARVDSKSVEDPMRAMIQGALAFNSESGSPAYLFKHFLSPDNVGFDYPPRLIRQCNAFRPETVEWADSVVSLPPCDTDPWYEVEIVRMLGSVYLVTNTVMLDGEVVAEVDPVAFMPYAWTKWDPKLLGLPQEQSLSGTNRPQKDAA